MMKKILLAVSLIAISLFGVSSNSASAKELKPTVNYAPPVGTMINGVEESQIRTPMIIDYNNPIFVSYTPLAGATTVNEFKYIAGVSWDNTRSSSAFPISIDIAHSASSGSEFSGSVSFSAGIKASIIGKLNTTVTGGVKETRSTDEAKGWHMGPLNIPAGKSGGIDSWWVGKASYGSPGVKYVDTGSTSGYTPTMYSNINTTVHSKEYQKIYGKTWTK